MSHPAAHDAPHLEPHDAPAARARRIGGLAVLVLVYAAVLASLAWRAQPVPLPDAGAGLVPCVSYAPFRRPGHTPFDAALRISPAQIEEDLRLLAAVTGCVRTYGLDHGLDAVPAIARRLGLRVVLGAWIGRDARANDDQLTRALALARAHSDVIDLLIVGNEVLLRRELTPESLAALLVRAKLESPVPVSYADVWEFWLRHGAVLRPHVHRIAAHVLPYWEDEPVGVSVATAHVHAVAARLRAAFAPLPVWVAETGWPAEGRQRGPARPGHAEQARFVREMLAAESARRPGVAPLKFNLIEGFDQPWKRRLEGAMGGYWGLFDAGGHARVPMVGPLAADEAARQRLWAAGVGLLSGAMIVVVLVRSRRGTKDGVVLWAATLVLGTSAWAVAAYWQAQQWLAWGGSGTELALGAMLAVLMSLGAALELPRLARLIAGWDAPVARAGLMALATGAAPWVARLRAMVLAAALFGVATWALQLVFDARYRPLVWPLPMLLAAVVGAQMLLGARLRRDAREERLLAAISLLAAPWLLAQEGLDNGQALALAASWLAWGSMVRSHRGESADGPTRRSASAPSKSPGAAGPTE